MNEIKPHNPNWYPPCFNSEEEYKNYIWTVKQVGQPMDHNNYCMDCTREYKVQMMQEKRCEHQETIFVHWRTTYKGPKTAGTHNTTQGEPDVIGISNISRFWNSPLYD